MSGGGDLRPTTVPPTAATAAYGDPGSGPAAGGGAQRILIVEDSATQAAALAALLDERGYETVTAPDGTSAIEALRAGRVDLVLSDIVMPGMNGYELCRRIKTELALPDLPVVLLTGLSDPMDIVRGLECGADNYITKPYERSHLLERVRQVLENRRLRDRGNAADGVDITFLGSRFTITAGKEQILDLLVSSYEELVRTNHAVREAEKRARFLADASGVLAASLDTDTILRNLARFIVPDMADVCVADLVEDDAGSVRRVEVAHAPSLADVAEVLRARTPSLSRPSLVTHVLRQREPVLLADLHSTAAGPTGAADGADAADDETDETLADARALGVRSLLAVPLLARGHTLGALVFLSRDEKRRYSEDDLSLATELARQAALAVDNARLYRAAQQATRARDDVLAVVSHDLRNPIHAVYMAATFLLDVLPEESDQADVALSRRQAEVIRRSARRANALIGDLLDVTRIEAGRLTVSAQSVPAAELVSEALHDAAPLAAEKELQLESVCGDALPEVQADRARVAQVFSNLLGNAVKFTPSGGRIVVRAETQGSAVRFSVSDTGPGIAADHLPHLFDRYWQATETQQLGTGLGLFIAKGITEAHGGRLWAESQEGQGATFWFTLRKSD